MVWSRVIASRRRTAADSGRAYGHDACMKFLAQVQADLKQAVLAHQNLLLLEVLRSRSAELTLGDLRKLLASPLGQGIDDVRVAELFVATAEVPGKITKKATARRRTRTVEGSKDAAETKRKPKLRKWPLEKLIEAVFAMLQSAKEPLSSTEVAIKLKAHRSTVRDVLQKLSAAKRIVISGSRQSTRYALPDTVPDARREAQTGKPRSTKAQQRAAAHPAVLTQADYDAAVLANLRAVGSMSSSQLQASVGGTLNEVRAALQRLIASQQASRVGERKKTRYVPGGIKLPDV